MAFRFSSPLGRATGASALLHAVGLAALLLAVERPPPEPAPGEATIELRLVETQGSEQVSQPAGPELQNPSPRPPPARGRGEEQPPPLAGGGRGRGQPPEVAAPVPSRSPQLNLAGDSMTNALVSGPGVIPAKIDARWRNREPVYPPASAQRREAGAVLLLVHVGPDGAVASIDVAESSGFPPLDDAARTAVATWHFLPAVHDGQPMPSDMPLRVVFQLH